ncbi:MAG TPA: hypothetical protein VLK61_25855 [Aquabacterium sp.]|nr:hypothetical protein [Aquabacterium sp.]HSW08017.1 hypothetical protein [Aquabacterium sp.]
MAATFDDVGTVDSAWMLAFSVARLTVAAETPGTFGSAFSTRATHEAQVMPVT